LSETDVAAQKETPSGAECPLCGQTFGAQAVQEEERQFMLVMTTLPMAPRWGNA
jgi:hypothetical protein